MEYFKLVMIINILAFCSFSGISGRNLPDHANDRFVSTSTTAPLLPTESASMTVSIRIMSFFPWTRNNLYQWFMTIPKGPYGGTDSSCKKDIRETNLGRPASPSTQPSPQAPPGPRPVSNIESPLSMKPPQIQKGPYGGTDSSCKNHVIETNLGRPASPSTQPSPQAPTGPRPVSNIESPLSMKPPQIQKGSYGRIDSSCKKHITETNLGRPASPSTQPSPQAPPGPRHVSNIELPFSKKPPQKLNLESA